MTGTSEICHLLQKTELPGVKVIVDSGGVGRYTSLAIDSSGNPRISYQDLLNAKLKYAAKNRGNRGPMKLLTIQEMLEPIHLWLWILPVIPTSVIMMEGDS